MVDRIRIIARVVKSQKSRGNPSFNKETYYMQSQDSFVNPQAFTQLFCVSFYYGILLYDNKQH